MLTGALILAGALAAQLHAQTRAFAPGETLEYEVRVAPFGRIGSAWLRTTAPAPDRLRFSLDLSGRVAWIRVQDRTCSIVDARTLSTLRYAKHERSPLGSHDEDVRVHGDGWRDAAGAAGELPAAVVTDELAAMFFVRELLLTDGDSLALPPHFDPARNPVHARVLGEGTITVPAGRFDVVRVELRVRDPRRYRGDGVITIQLSRDPRRLPVHVRTALPGSPAVELFLRSVDGAQP